MAFIVKTAQTIRTHWKKSLFGFCVTVYGIKYANEKHQDNLLRRQYCEEAKTYGDAKIELGQRPRRVTVFLNPAASQGKGRKLFEKTAAPILYLAGIEVNVISTEYEGQVKNFMAVLDTQDTDAVVVAGGNGTLLEAVTGFLRKEDKTFSENIPIGVIPLGKKNTFSKIVFGHDLDQVRLIAESAIAVVRAVTKKVDVIKLEGEEGKTIYALCGLEAGAYRDAEERKNKYWYFGPLKHRWTYLRTIMKDWPPTFQADISYLEANDENSRDDEALVRSTQRGIWSYFNFLLRGGRQEATREAERRAKVEEMQRSEAALMIQSSVALVEMTVSTMALVNPDAPLKGLQVTFGPNEPSRTELISEGWRRIKRTGFHNGSEGDVSMLVKKIHIEPKAQEGWFNIDGEAYEAMVVDISLLKHKINFFCPTTDTAILS